MNFLLGLFLGLCVGAMLMRIVTEKPEKPSGTFYMDFSDPMKDVCRLELSEDINDIYGREYIVLQVETQD